MRLLPHEYHLVTERLYIGDRKFMILHLGFLQSDKLGRMLIDYPCQLVQPHAYAIDVK
jgi:hypothetical protein